MRIAAASDSGERASGPLPSWYDGLAHVWLPYAQMKTVTPPLPVARTYGTRIVLADGRELIDGIASWWTACHGYNHPHIQAAIACQLDTMPHVMFGGLAHEQPLRLAQRLAALLPGDLAYVFFSDSGSVAVEVAMKMAVQYWINRGERGRTRFVGFRGGYHGDTLGAMSVGADGMHAPLRDALPPQFMLDLPCDEPRRAALAALLESRAEDIAALIVEPLVQGAGGMRFHEPSTLRYLREIADRYGTLLIFDEIFTGFGRTGSMFASEAAAVTPDIVTLSKALTGGTLPLAATVARRGVFEAFWSDDPAKALMHGPTFMANALACAAANASLDLFEREPRLAQVAALGAQMRRELEDCRDLPRVRDVRVLGGIGVVELDRIDDLQGMRRAFVEEGVFIQPIGSVVYLTPAFTMEADDLSALTGAIRRVLSRT